MLPSERSSMSLPSMIPFYVLMMYPKISVQSTFPTRAPVSTPVGITYDHVEDWRQQRWNQGFFFLTVIGKPSLKAPVISCVTFAFLHKHEITDKFSVQCIENSNMLRQWVTSKKWYERINGMQRQLHLIVEKELVEWNSIFFIFNGWERSWYW